MTYNKLNALNEDLIEILKEIEDVRYYKHTIEIIEGIVKNGAEKGNGKETFGDGIQGVITELLTRRIFNPYSKRTRLAEPNEKDFFYLGRSCECKQGFGCCDYLYSDKTNAWTAYAFYQCNSNSNYKERYTLPTLIRTKDFREWLEANNLITIKKNGKRYFKQSTRLYNALLNNEIGIDFYEALEMKKK